ncbi:hypothetical protein K1T71_004104 [Dendrolimus kikuchii]|uniref:Uncharacterized protein n=1 Tax=Dendrolimus kikuchii TaxID=765133 RepID=A0ACC1DA24_9NEOP|nr:hypothetical protein K1T71_004104 [Dendrolimus kikuchii]
MTEKLNNDDFPFAIENWDSAKTEAIKPYWGRPVSVGPKGYTFTQSYGETASKIYNLEVRPTDTVVTTMPRSGTTWTQEIVWLIANDLDFCTASSVSLQDRYSVMGSTVLSKIYENITKVSSIDHLIAYPDPRFIKTHMPLSLLPPKLLDTAKVVYVARDPRDAAVSEYFFLKLLKILSPENDFKTFWQFFMKGYIMWQPYFEHVKEAWEARHHPNMLFLFYEDLIADLPKALERIAKFFNKNYTNKQISELGEYVSFKNFKNSRSINLDFNKNYLTDLTEDNSFIRQGKVGAWREHFDEEMTAEAHKWIRENLRGTGLRYPSMENEFIN